MPNVVQTNFIPKPGSISFVVEDIYVKGGMRSVMTVAARDAIPLESRKVGMLVYVVENDKYFKLKADKTTWVDFTVWLSNNGLSGTGGTGTGTTGDVVSGISVVQSPTPLNTIDQNLFHQNAVGAFDLVNCKEAPNYTTAGDTDFMGLNFSSAAGDKLAQIGFGTKNGTTSLYIRTRPNQATGWTNWSIINVMPYASKGNSTDGTITVTKADHGFISGSVLAVDGTGAFILAKADSALTSEVVGIVTHLYNKNQFTLTVGTGFITGAFSGLIAGTMYYLSDLVAGELTDARPSTPGAVSKPVFLATSPISGFFLNARGIVIPGSLDPSTVVNLDTASIANNIIKIENNSGSTRPQIQVMDSTGKIRYDVSVTVDASWLTFDFTNVTTPTGVWHATVIA